jgi:hypothetical protein
MATTPDEARAEFLIGGMKLGNYNNGRAAGAKSRTETPSTRGRGDRTGVLEFATAKERPIKRPIRGQ